MLLLTLYMLRYKVTMIYELLNTIPKYINELNI